MRTILVVIVFSLLAACAAAPPGPEVFNSAQRAIENAKRAGAEELSPVELKFAREMLDLAHRLSDQGSHREALMAIERSEINAELAIEQSRTALERRQVNEKRRANEVLKEELSAEYGDGFND